MRGALPPDADIKSSPFKSMPKDPQLTYCTLKWGIDLYRKATVRSHKLVISNVTEEKMGGSISLHIHKSKNGKNM
jgi:hypothetical protein